jgi:hypothetical protein
MRPMPGRLIWYPGMTALSPACGQKAGNGAQGVRGRAAGTQSAIPEQAIQRRTQEFDLITIGPSDDQRPEQSQPQQSSANGA